MSCIEDQKTTKSTDPAIEDQNLVAVLDTIWNTEQIPLRKRDSVMRISGPDTEEFKYYENIYKKNHVVNEKKVKHSMGFFPPSLLSCNLFICAFAKAR